MNIILGITASVSAYKTPWLVRDLRRQGHDVRVIMTPNARAFVTTLALEATSTHPVIIDPYDPAIQDGGSWHVHMSQWADAMLIAPCSASTLSKLATGQCDNALLTVASSLPAETPLMVFPAMDTDMWDKPATQRNVEQLVKDGAIVIQPEEGSLASGLTGKGRLPDLETIVKLVGDLKVAEGTGSDPRTPEGTGRDWKGSEGIGRGLEIVITAGPTHEPIDAVRAIVNHSSGRMGFALAEAARDRGMLVTLIAGPVDLNTPHGVERIDVTTAFEMLHAVRANNNADVIVMAAAVADFTPVDVTENKIKKSENPDGLTIQLRPTVDILAELGANKLDGQTIVGFALEHDHLIEYAKGKLETKNADMIVANRAGVSNSGFGETTNTVTILTKTMPPAPYPTMSKRACAEIIIDHILELRKA